MPEFYFRGALPSSKSLLNRAMIIKSFAPKISLIGQSDCDDVIFLKRALAKLEDGREFYCGDGGTTLRFFALRASRDQGTFTIKGTDRLFQRPQLELLNLFKQLGVEAQIEGSQLIIRSEGWQNPNGPIEVETSESSQFASAVLLNAWNLAFPLEIRFKSELTSESYLEMTIQICQNAGMEIQQSRQGLLVPANQRVKVTQLSVEPDMSSAFAIAAAGVLAGYAEILNLPDKSLQPDSVFSELLSQMGAPQYKKSELHCIEWNLQKCPDLFPVLAVLCAVAKGKSKLFGAPQLRHKESDRIAKVGELLTKAGFKYELLQDGIVIEGQPHYRTNSFAFDPDHDHRMAMASGLLSLIGFDIQLTTPNVVNKSFPGFWEILKIRPIVLIGHRGVGKSSLLERTKKYFAGQNYHFFDLDSEIEKECGLDIQEIFSQRGENYFRELEITKMNQLLEKCSQKTIIAAGAGIAVDKISKVARKLWIRRETDLDGRIFLDRPRLDENKKPLQEYLDRAKFRQEIYLKHSNSAYTIPEGLNEIDGIEKRILTEQISDAHGCLTLLSNESYSEFSVGVDFFEIRDDLLEPEEILSFFSKIESRRLIYSLRKNKVVPSLISHSDAMVDWGLELGYPDKDFVEKNKSRLIISSHSDHIKDALMDLKIYSHQDIHLKLCPLIDSFEDLKIGHLWWSQNPQKRSFLPRSKNGIWHWYRLYMKGRQKINFWRHGLGTSLDQPTLWQWLSTPNSPEQYAAVLGHPVHHSYTPIEQKPFFQIKNIPIWAIDMNQEQWQVGIEFLKELGLVAAAVTSPLKEKAFQHADHKTGLVVELKSANTLWVDPIKREIYAHNTDLSGLHLVVEKLAQTVKVQSVALWGGGGTLGLLRHIWPEAVAYAARTGEPRAELGSDLEKIASPVKNPDLVVWAVPRAESLQMPPDNWKPQLVLDLNYKEDSMGREYALRCGANYLSGLNMFKNQAAEQRVFWSEHGC